MLSRLISAYNEAIIDTDFDRALQVARDAERSGVSPEDIVFQVVLPAMDSMVDMIRDHHDANLAQYFLTAQIGEAVTAEMITKFTGPVVSVGRVVIGNSEGDLHALGKKIVTGCLRARMVQVKDIGVNVPPEQFVDEAIAYDAHVIGISSMMVHTARGANGCLRVRQILHERRLEDRIKIVVGGAAYRFDHNLYKVVQADAWAENALTASKVIEELVGQQVTEEVRS